MANDVMKELQDVQEQQDTEKREKYETMRAQREEMMGRAATRLIEMLGELGPCFAVSIGYTIPGKVDGEAVTHVQSGWFDGDVGSAHLAQASDILNQKHIEIQKGLDKANLEKGASDGKEGAVREADGGEAGPGGANPAGAVAPDEGKDENGGDPKPS